MGVDTKIEWCDHTFNPWIGCTKVSPACDHCYAERFGRRFGIQWGNHARQRTSEATWCQPLRWNKAAKRDGVRRRVFCASLADVFDNQVDPTWRRDLWDLILACDGLDWLLLTKRPQNIGKMLPGEWPWPHVWLGTTTENQEEYDRRWPQLANVPAAKHFISYEPALGALDIAGEERPDWVIIGGESGPGARPCDLRHAHDVVEQCRDADVAAFVKQLGERPVIGGRSVCGITGKGGDMAEWPSRLRIREFPA